MNFCAENEVKGRLRHKQALLPNFRTKEARLKTFRDWPSGLTQSPQQLAAAGFYHLSLF